MFEGLCVSDFVAFLLVVLLDEVVAEPVRDRLQVLFPLLCGLLASGFVALVDELAGVVVLVEVLTALVALVGDHGDLLGRLVDGVGRLEVSGSAP